MKTRDWVKFLGIIIVILALMIALLVYVAMNDDWRNEMLECHDIFSIVESGETGTVMTNSYYAILMHNDTGVLYYYHAHDHAESMTPLYNEDGTVMTVWQRVNNG